MAFEFDKNLKDATFVMSKVLPAAGATNTSASFDLGGPNTVVPPVEVQVVIPATPALADTKNAVITMTDSADNSSFATVAAAPTVTVTGVGSAGAAAKTLRFRIPSDTRRYVQFSQAVDSAGGSNIAVAVTYNLLF